MYLYFYAPFLRARRFERELGLIEGRVTGFGISGKIIQLTQFLKFPAALREYGRKATTVVLVGDDLLLEEAVSAFGNSTTVLGFIPLEASAFSAAFSLPLGAAAVETLAARRIAKIDLGLLSGHFFMGSARCPGASLEIHCPRFSIYPKGQAEIMVTNAGAGADYEDGRLSVRISPQEGKLFSKPGSPTIFQTESLRIKGGKPLPVSFGAEQRVKLPLQIDSAPGAIKMIVGRKVKRRKN